MIRFDLKVGKAKVLDLTNPKIASKWGYKPNISDYTNPQAIALKARKAGYDVIKFKSFRAGGANYAVIDNFKKLLSPQNVSPVK